MTDSSFLGLLIDGFRSLGGYQTCPKTMCLGQLGSESNHLAQNFSQNCGTASSSL